MSDSASDWNEPSDDNESDEPYNSNYSDDSEGSGPRSTNKKRKKSMRKGHAKIAKMEDYSFVISESQYKERKSDFEKLIKHDEPKMIHNLPIPRYLWDKLKPHQKTGVVWMWKRIARNNGGILGDEMGLGKTLQVIAILAGLQQDKTLRNVLVIVPATLQKQWVQEIDKWWPLLRVRILGATKKIQADTVYVCSYDKARIRAEKLLDINWNLVICDEGHRLRNPNCITTRTIKRINTDKRILLTGSPIMNSLQELWSIVDFVQPGLLGKMIVFNQELSIPIQHGSQSSSSPSQVAIALRCAEEVRNIVKPILLRRLKTDVTLITSEKKEHVLFIKMTTEQEKVYKKFLKSTDVQNVLSGGTKCFGALQKLRLIVSHPFFLGDELGKVNDAEIENAVKKIKLSGKMIALASLLGAWRKQNRKVLIFTQTLPSLKMISGMCARHQLPCRIISGSTAVNSRQEIVNKFNNNDDEFCLVMTSRVGGVGLNIHGASRSIIFEPDWNPGQDEQAAARIHRPQQLENVAIYRLITAETVEEWIYQRQVNKRNVAQHVLSNNHTDQRLFSKTSLSSLLFGKGETSETLIASGAEMRLKKKPKKDQNQEPEIFPKLKKIKASAVDGEEIEGVSEQMTVEENVAEPEEEYANTEDWVMNRLFKKAGLVIESAVDQVAVTDGVDYKKIDEEAKIIASQAVLALHRKSNSKNDKKSKLKSKTQKSASILEKIRSRRDAKDEEAHPLTLSDDVFKKSKINPNYKLAQKLRDYIQDNWSGVSSDDIVAKFDGHIKDNSVFKALLKQIALLDPKSKKWKIKEQFRS